MDRILIFNGNSDKGAEVRKWVEKHDPTHAIVCEVNSLKSELRKIGRLYYSNRPDVTDVAVLIRSRGLVRHRSGRLTRFIFRGEPTPNMWRDRWYTRTREGRTVTYAIHANAIIADDGQWMDNEGAREWRKALIELHRMISKDKHRGLRVRVGGDMNFTKSSVRMSPNNFFRSLGMSYHHHNVMWFAWDPKRDRAKVKDTLGKAPGADAHLALLVELERT
jgi:hypothetical protein